MLLLNYNPTLNKFYLIFAYVIAQQTTLTFGSGRPSAVWAFGQCIASYYHIFGPQPLLITLTFNILCSPY